MSMNLGTDKIEIKSKIDETHADQRGTICHYLSMALHVCPPQNYLKLLYIDAPQANTWPNASPCRQEDQLNFVFLS